MVGMIDRQELKTIFFIFGFFIIWFNFVMPWFINYAKINLIFSYLLFLMVYSFFTIWFINGGNPIDNLREFLALALLLFVSDLVFPPLLISRTGPTMLPEQAQFASDYIVYSLLPAGLSYEVIYWVAYIVVSSLLLIIVALLLKKGKFKPFLRSAM